MWKDLETSREQGTDNAKDIYLKAQTLRNTRDIKNIKEELSTAGLMRT